MLKAVILRVQACRAIAMFATLSAAAAVLPSSAAAAASHLITSTTANRHGGLAGRIVDSRGQPLAGVCVTASAVTTPGRQEGASRAAVTNAGGMFLIGGLPVGSYLLRYRHCLTPAGSRPLSASPTSSGAYVTGGHLTTLGSVTVRPQAARRATGM